MTELTFRSIGENRGLDAAVTSALLVDRRGYLWVGSRTGLFRYDGYQATSFKPRRGDASAITDLDIRALYEDRDGIIWIATNTGGLNRLDPETGEFRHFRNTPNDSSTITHDSVYGMAEGTGNDIWAGSQIGLNRIDRQSGEITRYRADLDDPNSLPGNYVYTVFHESSGVLWVATVGNGLGRYNAATDTFTAFDLAALNDGGAGWNDVFAIAEDLDQNLWVGTRAGLLRMDSSRVGFEVFEFGKSVSSSPAVTALLLGEDGHLWVGTLADGVIQVSPAENSSRAYTSYSASEPGGLSAQPVLSLAMIHDMLFVGTWGAGLWTTRVPDADFRLHGTRLPSTGLRFKNVTAILAGDTPGNLLTGSFGGGVQTFSVADSAFGVLANEPPENTTAGVLSLARAADGRVLAGTMDRLLVLDESGQKTAEYVHDPADTDTIGEGYVTSLLVDAARQLWVGLGGSGLYRLNDARGNFIAYGHDTGDPNSLSGDYITSLLEEGADALWVGTRSNGLNLCQKSPWSCQRFTDESADSMHLGHYNVTDLHRDDRDRVWVTTNGGGLHQLLRETDGAIAGFRRWTADDDLISDAIMAVESDSDGSLWLSTRNGLTRLDPDQGRVTNFVEQSGLPVSHFNAGVSGRDLRYLYFGSIDGVLSIPRGRAFDSRAPAPVRVTAIERVGLEGARPETGWMPDELETAYGEMLSIRFATLDFAEVPHEYEFRVRPGDEWSRLGYRNEVTLLNLAPGSYQFMVRGRDIFGLWNTSDPLEIEVVPPFWMSNWFRLLVVAVLALLAFAAHRVRTRRLEVMALEIERLGARREQALEEALGGKSELAGLTPRQKEVLQLIAEGHSTRQIAERLNVSIKTVETHRAHLMDRLGIHDIAGLVRLAIRARLVSPHDDISK